MQNRPLVRLVDRFFVWVVVLLAGLEAAGQAIAGLLAGRLDLVVLWWSIGATMVIGTYALEIVKSRRDR